MCVCVYSIDFVFEEGLPFVFKMALALLKMHSEKILADACFESILKFIQEEIPRNSVLRIQEIIEIALEMPVSTEQLGLYAREFKDMQDSASSPTRKDQKQDADTKDAPASSSRVTELQAALEESQKRCRELEAQLATSAQHLTYAKAAVQSLNSDNKALEDQVKELKEENRRLREGQEARQQAEQHAAPPKGAEQVADTAERSDASSAAISSAGPVAVLQESEGAPLLTA